MGGSVSDWATDISRGGIFINTRSPLPVGTTVQVTVQIPGAAFPCVLRGRVTHVEPSSAGSAHDPGMGIEFTDVGHDDRESIETFVERMRPTLDRP